MGAAEDAVDAAAEFIGPFLDKGTNDGGRKASIHSGLEQEQLVEQALLHLQRINAADQAKDPNAPYDGSMVGVVYGLLDLITDFGIRPFLSPGVAFSQRPRSVLVRICRGTYSSLNDFLPKVVSVLVSISEQEGLGVHPLLAQRALPELISAVGELAFCPRTNTESHAKFRVQFEKILSSVPTSRLLHILTSFVQQDVPPWLRERLSKELAMVPLRPRGVRHTVEFLSLSYLSKSSQMPQEAGGSLSQIPIPLEAITQASRLLASIPSGMTADEWFTQLSPQLLSLLDGNEGVGLSRAAGQIIAGGILNRKSTGAPGTIGWELFARPVLQAINPQSSVNVSSRPSTSDQVIVDEHDLKLALKRLSVIASSHSHPGIIKRLIGPSLLPLWGLLSHARSRPLDASWKELVRNIMVRYISIACDPRQIDTITTNLFWDGEPAWTFGPGSSGGVEIRRRKRSGNDITMNSLLSRIGLLDERVKFLVSLLLDGNIDDEVAGAIFLSTTQRWLSTGAVNKESNSALTNDKAMNPMDALTDAKLSEAMATKFRDKFARSPQHIIELMSQLLKNVRDEHAVRVSEISRSIKPSRANLHKLVNRQSQTPGTGAADTESEDLASFALSFLNTLITSPDFKLKQARTEPFSTIVPSLQYFSQPHQTLPISPLVVNASTNLLQLLQPSKATSQLQEDPQAQYRATLKSALKDLRSPDPPNRTWALTTLQKLIRNPDAFPLIDIPSTAHLVLSASIADPESYVYTAAIPVLVDLAVRAPNPTLRILIDAFIDIDERSLHLREKEDFEQALDFRLRVGEILNSIVLDDEFWARAANMGARLTSLQMIVEAMLSIASRRGQRKQTFSKRVKIAELEKKEQDEGEAAWDGPIPNLLDPDGENEIEQQERDALLKIVQGWEDTGIEEDVRIRSSALSVVSVIMDKRLELLSQVSVDAGLQMVLQILVTETSTAEAILRRAAVLVIMGLLRGMDALLEDGKESKAGLGMKEAEELERVTVWMRGEDSDELVKGHAEVVVEALETWKMKKLFKVRDEQLKLGANLSLEGHLRGFNIKPMVEESGTGRRGPIVEEIE